MSILSSSNAGRFAIYNAYFNKAWPNLIENIEYKTTKDGKTMAVLKPKYKYSSLTIDCKELPCEVFFDDDTQTYYISNYKGNFDKIRTMQLERYDYSIVFFKETLYDEDINFIINNAKKLQNSNIFLHKENIQLLKDSIWDYEYFTKILSNNVFKIQENTLEID